MSKSNIKKAPKSAKTSSERSTKKVRLHHRVRQSFYSKHPFFVPLFTIIFLFFASIIAFIFFGGQAVEPTDTKIVYFHSEGKNVTIPTRSTTVKEFLEKTKFKYEEGDIIEPSLDTNIIGESFSINLYKAKYVTVIDESGKKTITKTAETIPETVVAKAGYKLFPEDKVEVAAPNEAVQNGVLGTQIKIDKASPVKFVLFGTPYEIRTRAKTVGDLAKERGVSFDKNSILPAPETPIGDNSIVFVSEPGRVLASGEEIIPKGQETVLDNKLEASKTEVRNEGSDGKKAIVYEIMQNGNKKYLHEIVIVQPVNKVIAKGTKVPALAPNINVSADKIALMSAAGISPSDYSAVDFIISHESGWRPGAGNASSGAYGLCQALPASKMASAGGDYMTNPVTQLRWCAGYANGRFGGWQGAYAFWIAHRWW